MHTLAAEDMSVRMVGALGKNRLARITAMLNVMQLGQRLCSSSKCTVHVARHQTHTIILCVRTQDQTSLNCDGTNDAQATWQRPRGSNRSQQQRNGICICRWCQGGLHSDDSHEKKHLLLHWLCAVVAFAVGDLCLRGRTRPHQTTPVVARNILDCITEQKRESWIGTEDHGPMRCTVVIVMRLR